jgi:hypothetical protein
MNVRHRRYDFGGLLRSGDEKQLSELAAMT